MIWFQLAIITILLGRYMDWQGIGLTGKKKEEPWPQYEDEYEFDHTPEEVADVDRIRSS